MIMCVFAQKAAPYFILVCSSADVIETEELAKVSDSIPGFLSIPAIKIIDVITQSSK